MRKFIANLIFIKLHTKEELKFNTSDVPVVIHESILFIVYEAYLKYLKGNEKLK